MNIIPQMYDFFAGPFLYITVPLCIAGLARKTVIIVSALQQGLRFPVYRAGYIIPFSEQGELSPVPFKWRNYLFILLSVLFHISIIAAPVTARGHGILLDLSWGILPPRVSPAVTSSLTGMAMVTGVLFLCRRLFVRHVRDISSWRDYALMISVLVPYVTGMMAKGMIGNYEIVMLVHCIGAHILLVAVGWTRLGHMIFYIAGILPLSGRAEDVTV
ncbi:MAG TPA: hypothetical protein PK358_13530 [Spirochaetota bacterium]|nr:hypothetical protein [Spirochaetota bacterium]HPJ35853.1 hypothetical protein [Spirochaetota bacterium]